MQKKMIYEMIRMIRKIEELFLRGEPRRRGGQGVQAEASEHGFNGGNVIRSVGTTCACGNNL